MAKTTGWYLVCDGKGAKVISQKEMVQAKNLKGVIIEITADMAARILMLEKGDSFVEE